MKRQTLILVALFGLLALSILPALAASVVPTKVQGSASCASVGSTGDFSLKIEPVVNGIYEGPGDVSITIELDSKLVHTFGFIMDGGQAHDVLVKGSAMNHYDYAASAGGPTSSDDGLTIPNGNALNHAIFCYDSTPEPTFSISGTKFEDTGFEGEDTEGGEGLEGWTIVLDGTDTDVTDEFGNYSFEGVSAGEHTVCEVQQDGWSQTSPDTEDGCHTVNTSEGDVTGADFGNQFQGEALECGDSVDAEEGGAFAEFTRVDSAPSCEDEPPKFGFVGIEPGAESPGDETIVFIPRGSGDPVPYSGELRLTKEFDDPNLLVLEYDPDADGPEGFRDVPACQDVTFGGEGGDVSATIPGDHTWCFYYVEAQPKQEDIVIESEVPFFWTVKWLIFGMEDPKFR